MDEATFCKYLLIGFYGVFVPCFVIGILLYGRNH